MTSTDTNINDAAKSPAKRDAAKTAGKRPNTTSASNVRIAKSVSAAPSRLDQLQQMLMHNDGASLAEMSVATGWQQHSIRGAMAGALKKRGLTISSEKIDGVRRYRAIVPA